MISINSKYPEMIFRKEVNGYTTYSVGISNKKQDGSYENGYIKCRFKKDVNVADRTKIIIKDGFVSFYKTKNNDTVPVLFITDFEEDNKSIENKSKAEDNVKIEEKEDPYEAMGKQIEIEEEMLPF